MMLVASLSVPTRKAEATRNTRPARNASLAYKGPQRRPGGEIGRQHDRGAACALANPDLQDIRIATIEAAHVHASLPGNRKLFIGFADARGSAGRHRPAARL